MIVIETERVFLRYFSMEDHASMAELFGDGEVMRFSSGVKSADWVKEWLGKRLEDDSRKRGFGLWAVVLKGDNAVCGYCGLSCFDNLDGVSEIEIGYRLRRSYWGLGIASEAAAAVREYGFQKLILQRLISIIDPRNFASINVAQKIGMQYEKETIFKEKIACIYSVARSMGPQ